MFFKDIDSGAKRKNYYYDCHIWQSILLAATLFLLLLLAIQIISLFGNGNYKLTAAGIIVVIILLTAGRKAFHWITSIMPQETQKQQIFRYSFEMVFALISSCSWIMGYSFI